MRADTINAAFEAGGAITLLLNIRQLWRDRAVSGVHWLPVAFFGIWGAWNLFYYPSLGQWLSFWAASIIALANLTWLVLAWRFGAFRRRPSTDRPGVVPRDTPHQP